MYTAIRWLDILFGRGDSDYPFWLLTVRVNILLFVLCAAVVVASHLSPSRLRKALRAKGESCAALALTAVAGVLRFVVARPNLMDYGGIPYSRLLFGYKGYFGTAQFYSLLYGLTARDIEHAILFDRIAGTLTIPLVYVLCRRLQSLSESPRDNRHQTDRRQTPVQRRQGPSSVVCSLLSVICRLQPGARLWPAITAFLFAVDPLHILFSASDALAIFSVFLAAASYAMLAGTDEEHRTLGVHYLGGFAGLALLTQVRYENLLFLIPPALVLWARRDVLRLRRLVAPLAVSAAFVVTYAYEAATAGISYQDPIHLWPDLATVTSHLVLNPFLAVPVLFIGTTAVWAFRGAGLGLFALMPWIGAFVLASVTTNSGHSAARIYTNWLILILPLAGYGFSLLLGAPRRFAQAVAAGALLYLGLQPLRMHDRLATQYLEILENDRFRALLATLPSSVQWIIVPDDDVTSRQPHSTLEVFHKYAMILAGNPDAARRVRLVGLTAYLEHPQQTDCAPGACVFFFGLPCIEPSVYRVTSHQCEALLRTRRTSVLDETTVLAAPFADCSIYTGSLRERLCDPATGARRFTVHWVE